MKNRNYYFANVVNVVTHPLFAFVWISFAVSSYFFFDIPLADYIHQLSNNTLMELARWVTLFGSGKYCLGFSALALISFYILKRRKAALISLFFLVSILTSGAICDTVKIISSRARPFELFEQHLYGFYFFQASSKMWSFPSGHATTAATVMIAASLYWPRLWPLFVGAMLAVAASRVVIGVHYLSDVMIGLYLGTIITLMLANFAQRKLELGIANGVLFTQRKF